MWSWRKVPRSLKTSNCRKQRQAFSRLDNCPFEDNFDGKWRSVVKVPNYNHPASPPEEHPMHQHLDNTKCHCGHLLWEEWCKSKGQSLKSQPWKEHSMQILFIYNISCGRKEELWFVWCVKETITESHLVGIKFVITIYENLVMYLAFLSCI